MAGSAFRFLSRPGGPRLRWWVAIGAIPIILAGACWWVTEPLTDYGAPGWSNVTFRQQEAIPAEAKTLAPSSNDPPTWPQGRLDGIEAKARLLTLLTAAAERLTRVESYTATFRKQERLNDRLGPEQTLAMKVRQKPFAIYFKFLSPQQGKEVVYAEGHHDNKLIAHAGGVARFLVPRLAVAPDHPLALSDARHPVTEAGLANLTSRLIHFRRLDLNDPAADTALDRFTDSTGRPWVRSVHTHSHQEPDRPFARIEVLYDCATIIPLDIRNYDWHSSEPAGELALAEHYRYDDLDLEATLSSLDFDPANPAYAFHRY